MSRVSVPHIAEAADSAMTRMEAEVAVSEAVARQAVENVAALDRFTKINAEIASLSRRNSNVRSLALSLGRKRTVTALCEDHLRALEESLAKYEFAATGTAQVRFLELRTVASSRS